jgi:ABC-type arginine/histidine transport system permease subunit
MSIINWEILRNPLNWAIIALILMIVAYGVKVIRDNANVLTPTLPAAGE